MLQYCATRDLIQSSLPRVRGSNESAVLRATVLEASYAVAEMQLCFRKSSFALFFSVQSKRPFYLFTNKRTEKEHRIQFTGCQNFAMEIKDME